MDDDDLALNRRVVSGDRRAFAVLVERHEARLRSFLARVAGAEDADDLAQETFLRAWRNASAFRGAGSYRGWLFTIGWRVFIDSTRRARVDRALRIAEQDRMGDACQPAQGDAQIDTARLLAALDPLDRACVILCHGQGWSHREAAMILKMPLGSLKTRLARATRRCEAMLNAPPGSPIND